MEDMYCDDPRLQGKTAEETNEKIPVKIPQRNNASIIPMGGTSPVMDYEPYLQNDVVDIWKGTLIVPGNMEPTIYFSRLYQPEINELDQIFVEIEILDTDLLGVPFILVPKEKLMFGYHSGSDLLHLNPNSGKILKPRMQ